LRRESRKVAAVAALDFLSAAMRDELAEMFLRLDAEENGVAPQPVAPRVEAAPVPSALLHSLERALERYGIVVRPQELVQVIESGSALLVAPSYQGSALYNVPVAVGSEIIFVKVVYAPPSPGYACGRIITVLPPTNHRTRNYRAAHEHACQKKKHFASDFRRVNSGADDFVNEQIEEEAGA
jgi:hypothetical protein